MGALDQWKEEIGEPVRKARENVEKWHDRWGGTFSGFVRVGKDEESAETRMVGDAALAEKIMTQTRLPAGVDPSAMFTERDRLRELAAECGDIMPSPAAITAQAIENLKEAA